MLGVFGPGSLSGCFADHGLCERWNGPMQAPDSSWSTSVSLRIWWTCMYHLGPFGLKNALQALTFRSELIIHNFFFSSIKSHLANQEPYKVYIHTYICTFPTRHLIITRRGSIPPRTTGDSVWMEVIRALFSILEASCCYISIHTAYISHIYLTFTPTATMSTGVVGMSSLTEINFARPTC